MTGKIHSFETFGTVDGPGVRFVIFMQGCPMRCKYCHNPDTWNVEGGQEYTARQVADKVLKYKNYLSGGVTLSGGEPLLQIDFAIELFKILKAEGIHTAVDTSGITFDVNDAVSVEKHGELLKYIDLVLLDIKHINEEKCKNLTGFTNKNALNFAKFIGERGVEIYVRYVVVPSITDGDEDIAQLKKFISKIPQITKVEVLPYHTMGVEKYKKLNVPYRLEGVEPPDKATVEKIKKILSV